MKIYTSRTEPQVYVIIYNGKKSEMEITCKAMTVCKNAARLATVFAHTGPPTLLSK